MQLWRGISQAMEHRRRRNSRRVLIWHKCLASKRWIPCMQADACYMANLDGSACAGRAAAVQQ